MRRAWVRIVTTAQFGLPAALYAVRQVTDEIHWYGAGWQMFSG